MTQKDKIKKIFLENPEKLSLSKIEYFLISEGFKIKQGRGSHRKIIMDKLNITYIYPVHNNEINNIYKKMLSKIYNKYFNI